MEYLEVMVTVKAYPQLGKMGETVCVAGVRVDTQEPEWVRLWPIPFRALPMTQKFKKYSVIRVQAQKSSKDSRPESWTPNVDTLEVVSHVDTSKKWSQRRAYVEPLLQDSMCGVQRLQKTTGASLAVFRPGAVDDLVIEEVPADWDPEKAAANNQASLLYPVGSSLEKIPLRFKFKYRCAESDCGGHSQSIIDWEIAQAWRDWSKKYDDVGARIRERWLGELCGPNKDTMFYTGNMHNHREAFLILGVFWPPK